MKIICKWESIRTPHDFYAGAMALFILTNSFQHATDLIESLIKVANSEYSGEYNNLPSPCELHKPILKMLISGLDVIDNTDNNIYNDSYDSNDEIIEKETDYVKKK